MTRSSHPSRHALPGVVVPAQLDYAIRGLVSLALATDDRTKIEVLADEHGLSPKFLAQVLATLRNAGIVLTHRGSDGGYRLARPPEEISVIEVFDLLSPGTGYEPRVAAESYAATLTQARVVGDHDRGAPRPRRADARGPRRARTRRRARRSHRRRIGVSNRSVTRASSVRGAGRRSCA